MRKFLLSFLVILTLPALAQDNYQYRISSVMSEDAVKTYTYNYAEPTGADLRGIHEIDLSEDPVWELIDSLQYDEDGRIIQIATHQNFSGEWRKVCWIDYTYNEMGLKATRKNYNDFNDGYGPSLGGTYYYYYDEDGKMTSWKLDFDNYDFQHAEITYNENGLIEKELVQQDSFIGVFENSDLTEYFYDDNNNNTQVNTYYWGVTDWVPMAIQFNSYDELGNCIEVVGATPDGVPQEKRVYKYNENILNENVFHYPNPENKFPTLPQMHNMVTSYESWGFNQGTGTLEYICDYLIEYEQIGEVELSVTVEASEEEICLGETIQLNANAFGGSGEYTYSWTNTEILDDATIQNPVASPTEDGEYTFTVTVNDGENTAEASVTVLVVLCDGVEEQILNNVNIYPNPAQDFIMIDSENVEYAEVIDIYGRVIAISEINGETRIDMSDFADGIYYVRLHSNGATAVQKIVKN